jgi:hypothetical protein
MNLSPFVEGTTTLASAVFAALAPVVVLKLNSAFKLNLDQAHSAAVATALDNAVGLGLQVAQEAGDGQLSSSTVRTAALTAMVGYVKQTVPVALSHFGLTDESIAQQAAARLATALHVSIPTPAPQAAAVTTPTATPVTPASPTPAAA